jgi:hypothetical protein
VQTQRPVLATGSANPEGERRSFAVSAWVRLADATRDHIIVSQAGAQRTMFELGYRAGVNRLCFSVSHADTPAAAVTRACTTKAPAVGQWTHLAGVFDVVQGKVSLYINGGTNLFGETAVVNHSATPYPTVGPLLVGRGWSGGAPAASWLGDIDEVWAYQRVLTEEEIEDQALTGPFGHS